MNNSDKTRKGPTVYILKDKFGETVMRTLVDEPFTYSTRNGAQTGKRILETERKEKLTIHRL